jgi:WD40 repeat protein
MNASASDDHTVKIWDAETRKCQQALEGHGYWVTSMVFSHDSRQLASVTVDRTIKIWKAETGNCLETLDHHGKLVSPVVFWHDSG